MSYIAPPSLVSEHEPQRLRTLYQYRILNTTPEPVFDHLTSLAAQLFDLPISLISLVDEDEVFFKSTTGLPDLHRLPRADSLCSAAVLETEVLVFRDLSQERCALVNPLVAEAAGLRFYAGAALRMPEGGNIGTLCAEPAVAVSVTLQRALLSDLPQPDHLQWHARYLPAADTGQVGYHVDAVFTQVLGRSDTGKHQ